MILSTSMKLRFPLAILTILASFLQGQSSSQVTSLKTYKQIIANFMFINDFKMKAETRDVSDEIFWKYNYEIEDPWISIDLDVAQAKEEIPLTQGAGRAYEHLNEGRRLYLAGDYNEARATWLSCRARYGTTFPHHRRLDYMIAHAYLALAREKLKTSGPSPTAARGEFSNAATFLSWAYVRKGDLVDPLLDAYAPKQIHNLSSIYFNFKRYSLAYSTAEKGLAFLDRTGRTDYRSRLKAILAETYIQNKSYKEAIAQYDSILRFEDVPSEAARILSRAGDIYFALNNYEIAEYLYALADRLSQTQSEIDPDRLARRGESLFWQGHFSDAQKKFSAALKLSASTKALRPLSLVNSALSSLRLADAYLALKKNDKARLEYFRVIQGFNQSPSAQVARVRSACLELPFYDGNNVSHARKSLEALKANLTPDSAKELAWACEVGSYSARERTSSMVDRVKEFYQIFPRSKFLAEMVPAVKEVKAAVLDEYFVKGDQQAAISYFEQTRSVLFETVPDKVASQLFRAYIDHFKVDAAKEFWPVFKKTTMTQMDFLRAVTFLVETNQETDSSHSTKTSQAEEIKFATDLANVSWKLPPTTRSETYVNRVMGYDKNTVHLTWIYNLVGTWAEQDVSYVCSYIYPTIARIWDHHSELGLSQEQVRQQISGAVSLNINRLLKTDESCGISFMDLEIDAYKDSPSALAALYIARQDWRINKALASLFWEVAEKNHMAGLEDSAKALWRIIVDKAPKDSSEAKFAKLRLENMDLDYNDLWETH